MNRVPTAGVQAEAPADEWERDRVAWNLPRKPKMASAAWRSRPEPTDQSADQSTARWTPGVSAQSREEPYREKGGALGEHQ